MFRFFIFFVAIFLQASSLNNSILQLSSKIDSVDKGRVVRVCHDLKSDYIKAIIQDDKLSQISAIKGLIKCSKIFKTPYRHYIEELNLLQKDVRPNRKADIKQHRERYKKIPYVRSIKSFQNRVVLTLSTKIAKDDIKFYELNYKKRYRDIFDIKAILNFKIKKVRLKGVKSIRVSQYKKDTLRVVLESNRAINSIFSVEKDKIIIKVDSSKRDTLDRKIVEKSYTKRYFNAGIKQKTIIIDPGHGGKDSGAIGYKHLKEKNAVLRIALKLGKYLKEYGYKVYYTRSKDVFIRLRNRTHYANIKKADIFISIHANAAPKRGQYLTSKGVETYFLSPARSARAKRVSALENRVDISSMDYYTKQVFLNFLNRQKIISSNKLAIDIQRGILKTIRKRYRVVDGGVRKAPFWVLVGAQMPAVLVETGYITNPTEATRLFNPYYESLLAKGIANGIVSYFEKNQ